MATVKLETGEELEFDNNYSDEQISQAVDEYLSTKKGAPQPTQQSNLTQPRQGESSFEENIARPALRATKSVAAAGAGLADLANLVVEAPLYAGNRAFEYGRKALTGQEVQPYQPVFAGANVAEATRQGFDNATDGLTANRNRGEQLLEIPQEIAGGFISPTAVVQGARSVASGTVNIVKQGIKKAAGVKDELINNFNQANIDPRLADVSNSKPTKGLQNFLEVYPGGAQRIQKATDNQIAQIEGQLAGLTKSRGGTIQETGKTIQQGAKDFKEFVNQRTDKLYDDLDKYVLAESQRQTSPKLMRAIDEWTSLKELEKNLTDAVEVNAKSYAINNAEAQKQLGFFRTNTRKAGAPLITMAAEEAKNLDNVKKQIARQENIISSYEKYMSPEQMQSLLLAGQQKIPVNNLRNLMSDASIQDVAAVGAGDTAKVLNRIPALLDETGNVSYPRLKIFRTTLGQKLSSPSLMGDERAALKKIYGSISEDMKAAIVANGGEKGLQAFNKANNAFARSQELLEKSINPLIEAKTPESVYSLALSGSKQGGSNIKPIMTALNPTQKDFVRGTIVKKMGTQNAGLQDATGEVFSPNKFLTEWNKMDNPLNREAIQNIFTPDQVKAVRSLNKAIASIKETSKIANKSNTVPGLTWAGLGLGVAASPITAVAAGKTILGARAFAELFANPNFVRWLAKAPKVQPKELPKYISELSIITAANPAIREDVADYLKSIMVDDAQAEENLSEEQIRDMMMQQNKQFPNAYTQEEIAKNPRIIKKRYYRE
jgi:hypothetical protein